MNDTSQQVKGNICLSDNMLLIDLLHNERRSGADIRQIINLIDNRTGNTIYRAAACHFGFKVLSMEGETLSTAEEIKKGLKYSKSKHIDYSVCCTDAPLTIEQYPKEIQERLRKTFNIPSHCYTTRILQWKHFMPFCLEKPFFGRYIFFIIKCLEDSSSNTPPSPSKQTEIPKETTTIEENSMKDQLLPIKFHNDTIYLIDHKGEPFVPIRPIIENLGLAWKPQYLKLTSNPKRWSVTMMVTVAEDSKQREMVSLPIRKFPAFMLSVEPNKVKPEIRHKLKLYQEECDQVLWDCWVNYTRNLSIQDDQPLKSGEGISMKDLVKIGNTEIERITYKDTPVVAFKMIDQLHQRPANCAKRNFYENIDRFEENRVFFNIPYQEWNKMPIVRNSDYGEKGGYKGPMIFLTVRGYLMLAKSFTDDLASKVQEEMMDHYFCIPERTANTQ